MCCTVICWLTVSSRDCFTGTSFTAVSFVKLAMPAVKVAMVKVTANTTPVLCRIFHRRGWYVVLFKVGRSRCCSVIWWFLAVSCGCGTGTSFTVVSFVKLAMPAVKVAMVKVTANTTPVLCRIFHRRGWYVVLFKVGRSRCCSVIWWF